MKLKLSYFLLLLALTVLYGFNGDDKKQSEKINTKDFYSFININNVLMWVSNNGDGSHSPTTDGSGFYWPDITKTAVFEDGLVFGAKIGNKIRFNGNTYRTGLQAGKIINGFADDPALEKYRVYKIRKDWESLVPGPERDALQKDYNEWPMEDGAPYIDINEDGQPTPGIDKPKFVGDETLWFVSNDLDTVRTKFTYGSDPMGLEIQTTVFGYKLFNTAGDAVFKKYIVINKGNNNLEDMYFGYWSDPDMGDGNDDFNGCDTLLDLGFTYNSTNDDGIYGTPPPALGYTLVQGPVIPGNAGDSAKFLGSFRKGYKNLPMTSFIMYLGGSSTYRDPTQGYYSGSLEFYNYLQGNIWNGESFIDPNTHTEVKYLLAGDPVAGTGWYEGPVGWHNGPPAGDRRFLISSGPFNLAPGDTQEIIIAIHMALGYDRLNSLTLLRDQSRLLKKLNFSDIVTEPEPPDLHAVSGDEKILLWWNSNAEDYKFFDPFIPDTIRYKLSGVNFRIPVTDSTYDFEGYRVWQYKDESGRDPKLIETFDLRNGIKTVYKYPFEASRENSQTLTFEPILTSLDSGLERIIVIEKDSYSNNRLYNGSEYYFAVTAYAYNKFSEPPILESFPQIIKIVPGKPAIDDNISYAIGERIKFSQTSGSGDANIEFQIVDPYKLTGHNYKVEIHGALNPDVLNDTASSYSLIDITTNDTLIYQGKDFLASEIFTNEFRIPEIKITEKRVYDGMILLVHQQGIDSIEWIDKGIGGIQHGVKGIYEVTGPGGTLLANPLPVFRELNSTGEWRVDVQPFGGLQDINFTHSRAIGYQDYEIRFTGTSQYYTFEGSNFSNSVKASDTIPFQVWDIGNNLAADPKRLYIKILDINKDGRWGIVNDSIGWEPIYAFRTDAPYIEEIPFAAPNVPVTYRPFGRMVFKGLVPADGTILRLETWKPLSQGDIFEAKVIGPQLGDMTSGKHNIDKISVFPNPYFAANLSGDYPSFVRFTNLPQRAILRIYSLAGVFIHRIDKEGGGQYLDWNLRNKDGLLIGSGVYVIFLELPQIGTKIIKLAVVN